MTQITVPDDLAHQIAGASPPIVIVDRHGRELGQIGPVATRTESTPGISDEDLAEIRRRMADAEQGQGSFSTWPEIKARLEAREKA